MKIGQIAVNVENVERAVEFYKEVIGLPLLFQTNRLAFFQCEDTRLFLSKPETEEFDHPSSVLYFKVDDSNRAMYEALGSKPFYYEAKNRYTAK